MIWNVAWFVVGVVCGITATLFAVIATEHAEDTELL